MPGRLKQTMQKLDYPKPTELKEKHSLSQNLHQDVPSIIPTQHRGSNQELHSSSRISGPFLIFILIQALLVTRRENLLKTWWIPTVRTASGSGYIRGMNELFFNIILLLVWINKDLFKHLNTLINTWSFLNTRYETLANTSGVVNNNFEIKCPVGAPVASTTVELIVFNVRCTEFLITKCTMVLVDALTYSSVPP